MNGLVNDEMLMGEKQLRQALEYLRWRNTGVVMSVVIVIIFQLFQIFKFQIYVQSDDFGYIANTVFFSGNSWNPYTGDMTPYYPIGFSWLAAFIVKLANSPVTLYRGLLCYILFLQLLLMYVVYCIEIRFLKLDHNNAAIISLLYTLGAMAPQAGQYYMAEIPFALCTMSVLYFMLRADEAKGKRQIVYYAICGMLLAYSYTIHSRFLVLAVGTVLTLVVTWGIFKRKTKYAVSFALSFCFFFLIFRKFVLYVQNTLYASTVGKEIAGNDAVTRLGYLSVYIKNIFNIENAKSLLMHLVSLLASVSVLTGGLFWIVLGCCFQGLYENLKKKKKDSRSYAVVLINIFGIICFFGMDILVAGNGVMNSATETRWLTFYRYGRPFVGIFVLTGFSALLSKRKKEWIYAFSAGGVIISALVLMNYTAQRINSSEKIEVSEVGWFGYYFYENQGVLEYFSMMSLIMASLYLVYLLCYQKGYYSLLCTVYLIFSLMLTVSENNFNVRKTNDYYSTIEQTYNAFQKYSFANTEVYFQQSSYAGKLRYALYNEKLHYVLLDEGVKQINYDEAVLLTDRKDLQEMWGIEADRITLSDWEYIYTSDNDIIGQMENGYEIQHWQEDE